MTREKAIKGLKVLRKDFSGYKPNEEMFDMAIKALEQEPCEDCVSRTELLKLYENRFIELQKAHKTEMKLGTNWCINTLKDMPPVTPTRCIAKISFDKEAFQKIVDEKVQELVTHGTCKDCSRKRLDKEESEEVGAEKYFCPVVCGYVDETPDFYCEKFEKGGSKNARTN